MQLTCSETSTRVQLSLPATTLGDRLRAIRIERFGLWGIHRLAASLQVSPAAWAAVERGGSVRGRTLVKFMDLTGASPLWLFTGEGERYLDADK